MYINMSNIVKFLLVFLIWVIVFTIIYFIWFQKPMTTNEYIIDRIGVNISSCGIQSDNDSHGGFHGDGDRIVIADCSDNNEEILKQIEHWKSIPLSDNLQILLYGGETSRATYSDQLSKEYNIPKIESGYYYFIDRYAQRYNDIDDVHSDQKLLSRYAYNFTLALYDVKTDIFYFLELDT